MPAGVVEPLRRRVSQLIPPGPVKDALSGTWLGPALHPMLTDLPIGCWTSAMMLDVVGGRSARPAARSLVALGVLTAIPAAAAGAADWSDTDDVPARVGAVHAASNGAALLLFGASWIARRRGHHGRGVMFGFLGAGAATIGGYLGGTWSRRSESGSIKPRSRPAPTTGSRSPAATQCSTNRCEPAPTRAR